ncbi:hypothetical protein JOE62_001775 [Glutamicibacter nicotianae]|nr:hypothetical protein [Glutamicibacter nicotianae]
MGAIYNMVVSLWCGSREFGLYLFGVLSLQRLNGKAKPCFVGSNALHQQEE